MLAQLRDISGKIRYTLGAQIDVSNLIPDSTDVEGVASRTNPQIGFMGAATTPEKANKKDGPRDISDTLDMQDRRKIQNWRARTVLEQPEDDASSMSSEWRRPAPASRGVSYDSLPGNDSSGWVNSRLSGFYQNVSSLPSNRWL